MNTLMSPETQAAIRESFHRDKLEIIDGRDPYLVPHNTTPGPEEDCLRIVEAVCKVSGLSEEELTGNRRSQNIASPRQIVYALIHERHPAMMHAEIARFMHLHQSPVRHGLRKIEAFKKYEPETRQLYRDAKRELKV